MDLLFEVFLINGSRKYCVYVKYRQKKKQWRFAMCNFRKLFLFIEKVSFILIFLFIISGCDLLDNKPDDDNVPPPPIPLPGTATNLSVFKSTPTSIEIRWSHGEGAFSDIVYRSLSESGDYTEIGTGKSYISYRYYTDTELPPDTTYYYKVAGKNASGLGPLSEPISATTLSLRPYIPLAVSATGVASSCIMIKWSSATNADEYNVYRSSASSGNYEKIGETSATSYIDKDLPANTRYYYKVSGVNDLGESELSNFSTTYTLVAGAGLTWGNAIEWSLAYGSLTGYIPVESNAMWYKFSNSIFGQRKLSAEDRTAPSSPYTADIAVDLYQYSAGNLYYLTLNYITLTDIDIGKGTNDPNNISASNWPTGTFYVCVKPKWGISTNKGTFSLRFGN
ncbi:MAG: hypothetical protein LBH43_07890 [Treponema sp.]|nr:hypothetical protein [Treponema sp.]